MGAMGKAVYVALVPPRWAREHLAVPGGEPADDLHLTLAYLGKAEAMSDERLGTLKELVADFASRQRELKAEVGPVGRFEASESSKGKEVVWREVKATGLTEMRSELVDELEAAGFAVAQELEFVPHMTVSLVEPGRNLEVAAQQLGCRLDSLWLFSAGEPKKFALEGRGLAGIKPPAAAEEPAVI